MKKVKLFVLHTLLFVLGITIGFANLDRLLAIPLTYDNLPSSLSRSIQIQLEFPNDEKKLVVQRIEHNKEKNITLLHGIQVVDQEENRYYVQDDYEERDFICKTFNFIGAFNQMEREDRSLKTPIIALSEGYRTVKLDDEEEDMLVPDIEAYKSSVSRLEVLPCQMKSS